MLSPARTSGLKVKAKMSLALRIRVPCQDYFQLQYFAVLVTWQMSVTKTVKAGVQLHCPSSTTNLLKGVGPRVGWWGNPPLPPGLETAWRWLDGTTAAPAPSTSGHGGIVSAFLWEKATSGLEQFPLLSSPVCVFCLLWGWGWGGVHVCKSLYSSESLTS